MQVLKRRQPSFQRGITYWMTRLPWSHHCVQQSEPSYCWDPIILKVNWSYRKLMPQIFFIHSSEEIHCHLSFNIAFWPHSITKFPNSRRHVTIFLWPPLFNLVGEVCLIQKYIFLWFEDVWYVGLMVTASKGISANADCSEHKETERALNLK